MNKYEAEKIINKYGAAIGRDENAFKKQSTLPCSKEKIRDAFYVYIPAVIEDLGNLPKHIGENLVMTYSMMDIFVSDEEADRLNKIYEKIENKELNIDNTEDKKQIEELFAIFIPASRNGTYFDEINDLIEECHKDRGILRVSDAL